MKTTIELADDLFSRTRSVAQRDGETMRSLIEEGLRLALAAREQRPRQAAFRLRTFAGKGAAAGLTPEFSTAGWDRVRSAIYEDSAA